MTKITERFKLWEFSHIKLISGERKMGGDKYPKTESKFLI